MTFTQKHKITIYCTLLILVLQLSGCTLFKETSEYDRKIRKKGVLVYLHKDFYFFPLKNRKIKKTEDLFKYNVKDLNGFVCESFLRTAKGNEFSNRTKYDMSYAICEYNGEKTDAYYSQPAKNTMALVEMSYTILTDLKDKLRIGGSIIKGETRGYCINIVKDEMNYTFKFTNEYEVPDYLIVDVRVLN